MNTPSPAISNSTDLVLQLTGGDRNGQLLPVTTAKCLLSSLIADKADAEKYRCAIFRGEKGVAFRSYSELVLVNGTKTSVQWLKEGDTIQLTPEMNVVVKQLGTFGNGPKTTQTPPVTSVRRGENTIAMPVADVAKAATAATAPAASTEAPTVDQRMNTLSDQLTSLVGAASTSGAVAATAGLTNQTAPETPVGEPLSDKKMADASSSIQEYLDKALATTGAASIASPSPMPQTPAVAPTTPADVESTTTKSRQIQATLEITETPDASPAASAQEKSPETVAKLRKEEVTSSLNRLLSGADPKPVSQELPTPSSVITADEQLSAATSTDSTLLPTPTLPTNLNASEILNAEPESPIVPPVATPPAADIVGATATVDASKPQSLDFLKSLGIDADELGLSNKTPTLENTTPELPQPELDAPRENTPSTSLPTADEIIALASAGSVVSTEEVVKTEAAEPETAESETSEPIAVEAKAESVADVLARMQNAGSLDSFSMDGPAEETSPVPTSEPAKAATPKPQVTETVVAEPSTESNSGSDEDNSVEDYMSQLLTRMRGGADSEVADDTEAEGADDATSTPQEAESATTTEVVKTSEVEDSQETLTAEQFKPKQKAVRMKSFDSLREIANNSNRLAIQDHLATQRKVSTQTKLQLAGISLVFGILFFAMSCLFSAQVSIGGMFCGVAFLICGVVFAKFYRDEKVLDENLLKAQSTKA